MSSRYVTHQTVEWAAFIHRISIIYVALRSWLFSFTAGDGLHLTSHAYRAISLIFDLP